MITSDYMCKGQMSLWDIFPPTKAEKTLDDYTEEEMVKEVSRFTGISFTYKDSVWGWVFKRKKETYDVKFLNYDEGLGGKRFISCGWGTTNEGMGSPCDSIDEAVKFFARAKERSGWNDGDKDRR